MQEVASDLGKSMLNGLVPKKEHRPSGKFICCKRVIVWITDMKFID